MPYVNNTKKLILKPSAPYRITGVFTKGHINIMMQLYSYYRSSSSYRVRIALKYKGLAYKHHGVHLLKNGGEQHAPEYKALNPQELVPTLIDGNFTLTQSMAILEYLEEKYPKLPILP